MFPCDSIGGENVSVFAKCVSDSEPITLKDGEAPLVELVNPRAELTDRGLSLVIDGVKRLPEQQKAKS
jgi:hypothetical protein